MKKENTPNVIDIIAHHRHDSMNHLQVIYGYVTMKKYDRIVPYIQKVTEEYQQESKLSQIGIEDLSAYLLTYNALHTGMKLNVQISDNVQIPFHNEIKPSLIETVHAIIRYFEGFENEDGTANILYLHIDQTVDCLILEVSFETEEETLQLSEPVSFEDIIHTIGGKIINKTIEHPTFEWDIQLPFLQPK